MSVISDPVIRPVEAEQPPPIRGLFAPTYRRATIFAEEVTVRTAEIPRWRPKINLDPRSLRRDDD
jgi:hypothetical protein